jgi:Cdc6-like AAA superfamily ATPase
MSAQPNITSTKSDPVESLVMLLLFIGTIIAGPVTIALSAGLYIWVRQKEDIRYDLWLLAGGGVGVIWLLLLRLALGEHLNQVVANPVSLLQLSWLASLPLIPLGAVLMSLFRKIQELVGAKSLAEQAELEQRAILKHDERLSRQAQVRERQPVEASDGHLRLGTIIKGDNFPKGSRVHSKRGWLSLDEKILNEHFFILGTTGAGKSVTITQLCSEILSNTARDLFLVDGKGEDELAQTIRDLAWNTGRGEAPIFRLGMEKPGAPYDGFRGKAPDIYNRLAALVGVSEAEGNARIYASIERTILKFICDAPAGPPRSFDELEDRLDVNWLKEAWKSDPRKLRTIAEWSSEDFRGLKWHLMSLILEFSSLIQPEGFALEESRCAIFSLRTQSVGDTAARLLEFMIEDLKDFIGKRQRRPAVLIIDEFGTFKNENIVALLSLARSAEMGVILATQDTANLGEPLLAQQILANTRTKLLMVTDFPEQIAMLAGTVMKPEASAQVKDGEATGMGNFRMQHQFKIDMNEVARLGPGEAFLIRQRFAAKLKIAQAAPVPQAPPEDLERWAAAPPAETPRAEPKQEPPQDDSDIVPIF